MEEPAKIVHRERIKELDVARALCALWVVGYWHLACYLPDSSMVYTPIGQCVTEIFMACFFYISGFLHKKQKFSNTQDIQRFFVRKLERFYILFVVATLSLYIANQFIGAPMFYGLKQLLLTLSGLTTLFPPHAGMLWFMSMIMLFYMLTPFINYSKTNWRYARIVGVLVFFFLWMVTVGKIDKMVFVYFIVYSLGLLSDKLPLNRLAAYPMAVIASAILGLLSVMCCISLNYNSGGVFFSVLAGVCGTLFIISISNILSKSKGVMVIMDFIAYGSLCAYLFHRHYYSIINSILEHYNIESTAFILMGVYLPVCILASWIIQKTYDNILSFVKSKNSAKLSL